MNCLKKLTSLLLLCLTTQFVIYAQDKKAKEKETKPGPQTQSSAQVPPSTAKAPLAFGLSEDTPVKLKLTRTMSSKDAKVNDKVDFEVLEDVKVGDVVVIKQGGIAIATVTEAQPKRRMGRAGKLNINIDYVQLVDGEKVPLRAVKGGSGGSHTGAMTGAIVASGILFFPAAPFFLFMHGKDITIPKGTEVSAYIAADTPLDPTKFNRQAARTESVTAKTEGALTATSAVVIKSTPDGAEITIDGKFVGTTPSTLQLTPGEHTIIVQKSGFKSWQRMITMSNNGNITVDASLEKSP